MVSGGSELPCEGSFSKIVISVIPYGFLKSRNLRTRPGKFKTTSRIPSSSRLVPLSGRATRLRCGRLLGGSQGVCLMVPGGSELPCEGSFSKIIISGIPYRFLKSGDLRTRPGKFKTTSRVPSSSRLVPLSGEATRLRCGRLRGGIQEVPLRDPGSFRPPL